MPLLPPAFYTNDVMETRRIFTWVKQVFEHTLMENIIEESCKRSVIFEYCPTIVMEIQINSERKFGWWQHNCIHQFHTVSMVDIVRSFISNIKM